MTNVLTLYRNRQALLVTKHEKEKVIAPLFYERLGISVECTKNIDTDALGTFSGEIERPGNQIETLRAKAKQGFDYGEGIDLFIASEGAFNPHPDSPFITLNTELVLFVDRQLGLEVIGQYNSLATNLQRSIVNSVEDILVFAEKVNFPDTGVILKHHDSSGKLSIHKNCDNIAQLLELGKTYCSREGKTEIETDLRAHRNPLRRENIRKATSNLLDEISSVCPKCQAPGFALSQKLPGLPCALCKSPTHLPYIEIRRCGLCHYTQESKIVSLSFADPQFCDFCNP